MPAESDDWVVFLPNKAGPNNAIVQALKKSGKGYQPRPKNGMYYQTDKKRYMLVCDPFARLTSMFNFMTSGRMSMSSKYVGLDIVSWCHMWVADHLSDRRNKTNSWFDTLTRCRDLCQPDEILYAEDMEGMFKTLGLEPADAGVWFDCYRHRRSHTTLFAADSESTSIVRRYLLQDCENFNYSSRENHAHK